jgi:hypothetical protein
LSRAKKAAPLLNLRINTTMNNQQAVILTVGGALATVPAHSQTSAAIKAPSVLLSQGRK